MSIEEERHGRNIRVNNEIFFKELRVGIVDMIYLPHD